MQLMEKKKAMIMLYKILHYVFFFSVIILHLYLLLFSLKYHKSSQNFEYLRKQYGRLTVLHLLTITWNQKKSCIFASIVSYTVFL